MANEIWAALIQAVPITGAAWVGWRGLNTWRTQLREGRQVEHAERALAAAEPMFRAIRFARSHDRWLAEEDTADPTKKWDVVLRQMTQERLRDAGRAFVHFGERYALAGLYSDRAKRQMDVAAEVGRCLGALHWHARIMWSFEEFTDAEERELSTKAFYAPGLINPARDDIEERLLKAQQALQAELSPILLPKARRSGPRWARFIIDQVLLGREVGR